MMVRQALSVAVAPAVDLVVVVTGKEHRKQKVFQILELPVLDSLRQKRM